MKNSITKAVDAMEVTMERFRFVGACDSEGRRLFDSALRRFLDGEKWYCPDWELYDTEDAYRASGELNTSLHAVYTAINESPNHLAIEVVNHYNV